MDRPVIVFPPRWGGRRVMVRGENVGTATSLKDVIEFLRRTGVDDLGETDLHSRDLIEWRGGGPDVWT